jgi:hypothetical protein
LLVSGFWFLIIFFPPPKHQNTKLYKRLSPDNQHLVNFSDLVFLGHFNNPGLFGMTSNLFINS